MKIFAITFGFLTKSILNLVLTLACAAVLFVAYKGNQPMQVAEAPKGMTYFQFMADRFDAAKTVKPARCGTGMIGSLFALGPIYATLYTHVGLHPEGFLAKVTAPDPDLPKIKNGAEWYEVPGIWWNTFENLSWTMLGKPHQGCRFRPVLVKTSQN
jgi:hypothetical protein